MKKKEPFTKEQRDYLDAQILEARKDMSKYFEEDLFKMRQEVHDGREFTSRLAEESVESWGGGLSRLKSLDIRVCDAENNIGQIFRRLNNLEIAAEEKPKSWWRFW